MEIQFISVRLRAAVKNEWGRGEQRHSEFYRPTARNPAVCTADAAAPKTAFPPSKVFRCLQADERVEPNRFL